MTRITNKFDDEKAVSPVIGVILMVAITVILAAVIGAFVLDLGSNQSQSPTAGVTIEDDGSSTITITVNDPGNVDELVVREGGSDLTGPTSVSAGDELTVTRSGDGTIQVIGILDGDEGVIRSYDYDFT